MKVVGWVALNVFRESVRDKVLYTLVIFAGALILASYLIGQLTAGQDLKVIKDLGLASISLFGVAVAVFIGIGLVWKEVDKRSIYNILSKPVRRTEFVLGKYAGLLLTLAVNVVAMSVVLYGVLAYMNWSTDPQVRAAWVVPALDPRMLKAIGLIVMELALVTGIALMFSTFSSPFLSAILTVGLWVIGQFSADLRAFEETVESPAAAWLAQGLYYVLPNFSAFDVKAQVVHGHAVDTSYLALTTVYGLTYLALTLTVATVIFARRDFK